MLRLQLGGKDSNPQLQDQNLLCCQLHHPRSGRGELTKGMELR